MKLPILIFSTLVAVSAFAVAWTPSAVLEPNHPRILFTSSDSAGIASRPSRARGLKPIGEVKQEKIYYQIKLSRIMLSCVFMEYRKIHRKWILIW